MKILHASLVATLGLFMLSGCSGTWSGSDDAYLKNDNSVAKTKSQAGAKLKMRTQYFPDSPAKPGADYTAPSLLPPGQTFAQVVKKKH